MHLINIPHDLKKMTTHICLQVYFVVQFYMQFRIAYIMLFMVTVIINDSSRWVLSCTKTTSFCLTNSRLMSTINCNIIYTNLLFFQQMPTMSIAHNSLSARILHRAPHPPAPSGPKFSNSENCCGSENAMPSKIFWDMEGHRGHFRSKNVFFFKKHILEKIHNKSHYFFNF